MKIKLTENAKQFIETLSETDRTKLIITEDTLESSDEEMTNKWRSYLVLKVKNKFHEVGEKIEEFNQQLRVDHPEYFE